MRSNGDLGQPRVFDGCLLSPIKTCALTAVVAGAGLLVATNTPGCEGSIINRELRQSSHEARMDGDIHARSGPDANNNDRKEERMDIIPEWMRKQQEAEEERRKQAEKAAKPQQ